MKARCSRPGLGLFVAILIFCCVAQLSRASSATWKLDPTSNDWNTAANWTPETIPNGPDDTATFEISKVTDISISTDTEVHSIVFAPGASSYTITPEISGSTSLTLSGSGITNSSGTVQNFITGVRFDGFPTPVGSIDFFNSASAGSQTVFTINGSNAESTDLGAINFYGNSSAGNASFFNLPSPSGLLPGRINFNDEATAEAAVIMNSSSAVSDGYGAQVYFYEHSSAGQGTFVCEGAQASGGYTESFVEFRNASSAGNATLTANGATANGAPGGVIYFESCCHQNPSTGSATLIANGGTNGGEAGKILVEGNLLGAARVIVSDDGNLDVSGNAGLTPLPISSLEGNGRVFLGRTLLEILSKRDTSFSGRISDLGGLHSFTNGSLRKVGRGRLVLTGGSDYTGGTTIAGGELFVNNRSGSATGTGAVQVIGGQLTGGGFIGGAVTVGTGTSSGAALSPGRNAQNPRTLTMFSTLILKADATYDCTLNGDTATADQVVANGVTIDGAVIELTDAGTATLPPGTTLTLISNTSANPISGTFSNLPDGGIVNVNGNNLQASYSGGDGNDLTLTVVP